eukprot:2656659-Rhodomonas_salina.3
MKKRPEIKHTQSKFPAHIVHTFHSAGNQTQTVPGICQPERAIRVELTWKEPPNSSAQCRTSCTHPHAAACCQALLGVGVRARAWGRERGRGERGRSRGKGDTHTRRASTPADGHRPSSTAPPPATVTRTAQTQTETQIHAQREVEGGGGCRERATCWKSGGRLRRRIMRLELVAHARS